MTESAVHELLDKQALHDLVMRWCRAIDRCDEELLRSTYHDDAIDEHGPFTGSGAEFVEHTKLHGSMNLELRPGPVQHSITNTLFHVRGDVAWGECYVEVRTVDQGRLVRAIGRFIDRFERRAGEWRIAHRRVVLESASPGYDVAAFTPGFRDRRDPSYERDQERDHHSSLSLRERELVRHRIAHLQGCELCATIRTDSELALATEGGIPDAFYEHVFDSSWSGYTPRERLLLELLTRFIDDHEQLRDDDRFWAALQAQFTETELVDVCYHMIGPMYGRGLMAKVLLGFTTFCAVLPHQGELSTESSVASDSNGSPTGTSRAMK